MNNESLCFLSFFLCFHQEGESRNECFSHRSAPPRATVCLPLNMWLVLSPPPPVTSAATCGAVIHASHASLSPLSPGSAVQAAIRSCCLFYLILCVTLHIRGHRADSNNRRGKGL